MTNHELALELLPGEYWWGGRAADGRKMPYGASLVSVDLAAENNGNQACPLLLSSKGRYIWSDVKAGFKLTHFAGLNLTHFDELRV